MNIQRDSYASYIGHYPMLAYFAIAENESIGRERYNFMQVSICSHMFIFLIACFSIVYCEGVCVMTSEFMTMGLLVQLEFIGLL